MSTLQPSIVPDFRYPSLMYYFEEISKIPRETYHEEKIADYLVEFAKERGISYTRDAYQNVFMQIPASEGYEDRPAVLLQGHTDMVCEKNEGVVHDFRNDPLSLYVKDGWLRADGTTLGADDGVAVASMLAILDGALPHHPAIQCLFTASEEMGMDGADHFDYRQVTARRMINVDSPDENQIIVGCAGGIHSRTTLTFSSEPTRQTLLRVAIDGLAGGHSGEDIHRGRANALNVLGKLLAHLSQRERFSLISIEGGNKENVITRKAEVIISVKDEKAAVAYLQDFKQMLCETLSPEDQGFSFTWEHVSDNAYPLMISEESTARVIRLMNEIPCGPLERDQKLGNAVTFSRNMGVIQTERTDEKIAISFTFLSRSAEEETIDRSIREMNEIAARIDVEFQHFNRYSGWHYEEISPLRDCFAASCEAVFGTPPVITVIHAGLECGNIKQKLPDMDMISCGPQVTALHSPDEALNLASFERFFAVLEHVLEN